MRILFLTNFYLTDDSGGEQQSCRQVVDGLRRRGHTTLVLTSVHGAKNGAVEADGVLRSLYLEMDLAPWRHGLVFFTQRRAREAHNLSCFESALAKFKPDIIFIWGMWNLPRSLAALAEARHAERVIYRFATYWPTLPSQHTFYWQAPGRTWYLRLVKKLLGRVALSMLAREDHQPPLTFRHAMCVSAATKQRLVEAGVPVDHARVIHTGVDAEPYLIGPRNQRTNPDNHCLRLLYAGRLVADKGVDTAIAAVGTLVRTRGLQYIRFTIAGSGPADYVGYLRQQVAQAGLTDHVSFLGHVPTEAMPQVLAASDVLLIPSIWPEPFSRMLLEGMIAGLAVIATSTGGTPEILVDGENGMLCAPGDAEDLAQKIASLAADPALLDTLAAAGRQTVMARFTKVKMMDEIESFLQEVVDAAAPERIAQA